MMNDTEFAGFLAELASEIDRRRSLAGPQRLLHQRILDHFAQTAQAPDPETFSGWAAELGIAASDALAGLVEDDAVEADLSTGRIVGAYPFVAEPRGHRVEIDGGCTVEAYCAGDALGIAALLGRDVAVTSTDPYDGTPLRVDVLDGKTSSTPPEAVIAFPADIAYEAGAGEPAAETVCPTVSFYASEANALAYGRTNGLTVEVLSLPQAAQLGTAVFGGLLDPSPR